MKITHDNENHKFFGETAMFYPHEREEAKQYLEYWKKFLVRRLNSCAVEVKILDEQWGERAAIYDGIFNMMDTMYLKLYIEGKWDYELGIL